MTIQIDQLDHLVLTVSDLPRACAFYSRVLGLREVDCDGEMRALRFGDQMIKLHSYGNEVEPHAFRALPGSADLCFRVNSSLDDVIAHLEACGVEVLEGPVPRTGALGAITSIYFRDPDQNLIEVARTVAN